MSGAKRQNAQAAESEPAAKKLHKGAAEELLGEEDAAVKELSEVQEELSKLDEECAKEQLRVQRRFTEKMRPHYVQRQKSIEKIKHFWARVLSHIPMLAINMCAEDGEILKHLSLVDVDDNLDDKGSYRITFKFADEVKEFFTPTTLVKQVAFDDSGEESIAECTEIVWEAGKSPIEAVKKRKEMRGDRNDRDDGEDEDDDDDDDEYSIFEWFSKEEMCGGPQVGEILRREVWHNPSMFLFDQMLGLSDEEDDGDEDA